MRDAIILFAILLITPRVALAAPCDRLTTEQQKVAHRLFQSVHPYDCCDEVIDRCLLQQKVCKLVKRLRDDICRRLVRGQDEKKIRNALARRARSMLSGGKRATYDLTLAPAVGSAEAPVKVVVYACARCPFCSKVTPDLYRMATRGGLKGKLQLHFRPFPIRSHPGALEGGMAMVAAIKLKKFWPFLLKLYGEYSKFAPETLASWAEAVGMDGAAFSREMKAKANRKLLVESKKEGLRNGVKATPTLFINGRKYHGDMDHDSLLDVLDEEADRVRKRQFCGGK